MSELTAIGYLVGAGSMTLGIEKAGYTVKEIWETPDYAVNARSWDLNRPELRHGVLKLDSTSDHFIGRRANLIYGNPPCGGVSSMDKSRGINSPTNACMRHWIRMVVKSEPDAIIMESGWQLDSDNFARLLLDLTNVLDAAGYWWWTWRFFSYQVGTPQLRRRMFLCATKQEPVNPHLLELDDLPNARDKTACPCWPYLSSLAGVEPSPDPVTTRDGHETTCHWYSGAESVLKLNEVVKHHRHRFEDGCVTPRQLEVYEKLAREDPKQQSQYERNKLKVWEDIPDFLNMVRFANFPVVLKGNEAARTMIGIHRFIHPTDDRILTIREMARLMGYPDEWRFHKADPHYAIQGVPVNNAYWVADRQLKVMGLRDPAQPYDPNRSFARSLVHA
jgi:DNA (cytosine-5)-methyltransferase 1